MYAGTSQRRTPLIRPGRVAIWAALLVAGCASPRSIELATETARAVDKYRQDVGTVLDSAEDHIVALRKCEEGQWNSMIAAVDAALGEYEPILNALDQNTPPPYLAQVSVQTQEIYRQRLKAEQQLTQLVEFTGKQYARFEQLKTEVESARKAVKPEKPLAEDVSNAKKQLTTLYRKLIKEPTQPTTRSLNEPDAYQETLEDVRAMSKSYAEAIEHEGEYYRVWREQFAERLTAFKMKMDALTGELRAKVETLKTEKATLEMHRTAFLQVVDDALQDLSESRDDLSRKGSATSELAHALVESVRNDVQVTTVVGTVLDVAMRVTTGLSLAGMISQRDGERISTLISTTGEVAGTIGGTTDWEARRTTGNVEELGIGSDTHG